MASYLRALLCLVVLAGIGCGDDGGEGIESDGGMDAGGDGDSQRPMPGRDDSGSPMPDASSTPGERAEGEGCQSMADCAEDLACVQSERFRFCARPCATDDECGRDACISYTGQESDLHCVNFEREQYGECGEALTAVCADRVCLRYPDLPLGICVDICDLAADTDADGGVAEASDAGSEDGFTVCPEDQACVGGVLAEPTAGVCGSLVGRGEQCGVDVGLFCEGDDICSREDPEDAEELPTCRQNCSDNQECEGDTTCTDFRGRYAVCL